MLIKNGILHPATFLRRWRDPSETLAFAGPWILATRVSRNAPHLYDNLDWLVAYQRTIQTAHGAERA